MSDETKLDGAGVAGAGATGEAGAEHGADGAGDQTPAEVHGPLAGAPEPPSAALGDSSPPVAVTPADQPPTEPPADNLKLDVPPPPVAGQEASDEADTELEPAPSEEPAAETPGWYRISTSSQPAPVHLFANSEAHAVDRFKLGHGIRHTPHKIHVARQAEDYKPTATDLDHNEAVDRLEEAIG